MRDRWSETVPSTVLSFCTMLGLADENNVRPTIAFSCPLPAVKVLREISMSFAKVAMRCPRSDDPKYFAKDLKTESGAQLLGVVAGSK